jgi:hypothetical protein
MKQIGIVMRLAATIDIFDYWNKIRGAEIAPLRRQIEPNQVRHILANLFMLELSNSGRITFRLAGTRICDLFGRDLGGSSLAELWAHGHEDIERTAMGVMEHAIPTLLNVTGYSTAGHRTGFEIILLPLRSNEGHCDKVLGCIAPATAASWLEIVPLQFLALDRSRLVYDQLARPIERAHNPKDQSLPASTRAPSIADILHQAISNLRGNQGTSDGPFRHS